MGSKRDQAVARRRNRQRKQQRREVDRNFVSGSHLTVIADYAETPDGWIARVTPEGLEPARAEGQDAHETFHNVLAMVEILAELGAAVSTIHQLNGSTTAWAELVIAEGFLSCVTGDQGPHHGLTLM